MMSPIGVILLLCFSLTSAELRDSTVSGNSPRNCYSCEGINCQRTSRQNVTVTCTDVLDICVTAYDDFMVTERGCLLELSLASKAKCNTGDKQCQKCNGELCNNLGRIDFQCIQCDGSENSDCNTGGSSVSPSQCAAPTSSNSYCYVKVEGTNLQRGCALSVKEQQTCLNDTACSLCLPENADASSACNNYNLEYSKSGAAQGQQLFVPLIGVVSLLALRVLQ
ncbi:uncharacterized protein LOC133842190 [Drosophila sulfurigaster albostrigata]|uniref:uncharacterized protein LOC133842190 n=1 Tax=Drosophila sulfurigaster albostrigata TaxID=89887 RepID=UPI002D21A4FC|nr:uncharacterized protein LOC133842190 [Drosophila sulfurigaster albostrigata]